MKFIKLLTAAYVGGMLRHPHEGVLHVEDGEAERLVKDGVVEDVSDDFSAKQERDAGPVESITVPGGAVDASESPNPHQSEVAPQATDAATKSHGRKPAASKE